MNKDIKTYGCILEFNDKLDLLRKVLRINAIVTNINSDENFLRPKLVDVLSFYILLGYSKETKNVILESLGINMPNLNQINSELSKKKYLIRDVHNFRKKHLSKELQALKTFFIDEQKLNNLFLINFKKTKDGE